MKEKACREGSSAWASESGVKGKQKPRRCILVLQDARRLIVLTRREYLEPCICRLEVSYMNVRYCDPLFRLRALWEIVLLPLVSGRTTALSNAAMPIAAGHDADRLFVLGTHRSQRLYIV